MGTVMAEVILRYNVRIVPSRRDGGDIGHAHGTIDGNLCMITGSQRWNIEGKVSLSLIERNLKMLSHSRFVI